jgi:hypothetical protein
MDAMPVPANNTRYGFYYYPDTLHYREDDISVWIPELCALGASWLTLLAPVDRAIPEPFLRCLIDEGIQPVLHFHLSTNKSIRSDDLKVLLNAYANWGVHYITLFDRPNQRQNWSPSSWAQSNLVERFLDIFIPIAEEVCRAGLIPVFPPLEPGGDYWDTAFLFAALQGMQRRGLHDLLNQLVLSAYAWTGNRSPNWGAGGPERWPNSKPYFTPQNSEDQIGFRIFDWYLTLTEAAIGKTRPIILLGGGSCLGNQTNPRSPAVDTYAHSWQTMTLVRLMSGHTLEYDLVPPEVLTCNFWILSAVEGSTEVTDAWYKPDFTTLPVVKALRQWVASGGEESDQNTTSAIPPIDASGSRPISHYLLLPTYEWGVADWHLEAIRPFVKKYHPTIGFSAIEAAHAKRVTVVGGPSNIPDSLIDGLIAAGCVVEHITGDGTTIASKLASL